MQNMLIAFGALVCTLCVSLPAEARGMGRFLGGLMARGAVSAAAHSGTTSSSSAKSYTPDALAVAHPAQCIRKASKLDEDSDRWEADRAVLRSSISEVDLS